MRASRPLRKLMYYVQRHGLGGIQHFIADMLFWRARNLRHRYRLRAWVNWVHERSPDALCVEVQGFRLRLNPDDFGLSPEIAVERVHEPRLTAALRTLLSPGMHVVDIGANLGYFTLVAAQAVGREGRVLAIEPYPRSFQLLLENIQLNGVDHVRALPYAVGRRSGKGQLFVYRAANWNSLVAREERPKDVVEVAVYTLDEIVEGEEPVHVLRMDVEGGELDVLCGAQNTLRKWRPILVLEVHPYLLGQTGTEEFLEVLEEMGYRIRHMWWRWQEEIVDPKYEWTKRWREEIEQCEGREVLRDYVGAKVLENAMVMVCEAR
jgi:FkbM family methyltransferase